MKNQDLLIQKFCKLASAMNIRNILYDKSVSIMNIMMMVEPPKSASAMNISNELCKMSWGKKKKACPSSVGNDIVCVYGNYQCSIQKINVNLHIFIEDGLEVTECRPKP